jgi:hypothetical protein
MCCVPSIWHLVSALHYQRPSRSERYAAKIPVTRNQTGDSSVELPQTLVRIPTEHAPALQAQADAAQQEEEADNAT